MVKVFKRLFNNKTNTEPIVPCTCNGGNEHCDLILQLREYQDLRKKIKKEIEMLNKNGRESIVYLIKFLRKLEKNNFRMHPLDDCSVSNYSLNILERTIHECSSDDIFIMTEELKRYRNKADIICEKQRELKTVEDNINNIKSKLGID